jgi:tetratricopeptide (TPR) repeat protein
LRQYQSCVDVLRRELGVEPEEETRRLYQDLLQTAPAPRPARATARTAASARQQPAAAPLARHASGFIGRREELARLTRQLADATTGPGGVAMVIGQAGVGKSRLLDEFASEARRHGARVLVGRAHESEQVLAFGPWVDALRAADVGNDDAVLASLRPAWRAELARLLPEVETPGLPPVGDDSRRLFESVVRVVEALAVRNPVIVVLEDLQWADEMTLRLLAFFGRHIRERHVLVVTTVREEDVSAAPVLTRVLDELRREPHVQTWTLPPLSRPETLELVRALAKTGAGDEVVGNVGQQIWDTSEGNPFVIVETMGALAETGLASRPLFAERVRQLITSRLDRLSARARRLLTVAAVIGREFEFALLSRVASTPEAEVAEDLEELVRRGILHGVGDSLDFTHQRVREVAYGEILDARRKLLHIQVAQALEHGHAANLERHYAALGRHYREGEGWEPAQRYLRLAGAAAATRFAHREAATCYRQALAALARLPENTERIEQGIDVRFALRASLWLLGEFAEIARHLRDAEALAVQLDDRRRIGQTLVYQCANLWFVGAAASARAVGARARAIAATLANPQLQLTATMFTGLACITAGEHRAAAEILGFLDTLDEDLRRQRLTSSYPVPQAYGWLAWSLADRGEFDAATRRAEDGLRLAEELGDPHPIAVVCRGFALARGVQGELDAAIPLAERSLAICREFKLAATVLSVTGTLGHLYALSGRIDDGLALLHEAFEGTQSLGFGVFHSLIAVQLGDAARLAGRADDAARFAERGLALAREGGQRGCEATALWVLGNVADDDDHFQAALALATVLEMRPLVAHCHLDRGLLYARLGKRDASRVELSRAAELFASMGMVTWQRRADAARRALS